ncbi:hypothetical protein B0H13DRAFT_2672850 [Mycena leptocephala]|nr:hypothetical protein B0H13DRAFT_2672850 [Mycena leptocephala]
MPGTTSSNTPAGGTAKPRMSSRHSSQGPATTTTPDTLQPPTPASPTFASPPTSPTATSKLPRFLQSPAQRDRPKSLSVDWPPSAASSSASYTTNTSNSTSTSSASGRRSATRFLGLGKARLADVARLCAKQPAQRVRQPERHFSAPTPPPSSNSSSSGHGQQPDLTLARSPSRLGTDGPLATRLSGWFAHLAGSMVDCGSRTARATRWHSRRDMGAVGLGVAGRWCPHSRRHGQTPTSPRIQHSPSQCDSSSAPSSSRGESGGGVVGAGAGRHRHGSAHSQGLSTYSNASFSSYASYSSSGTSFFLFVSSYLLSIFPCPPSSPPSNLFSRSLPSSPALLRSPLSHSQSDANTHPGTPSTSTFTSNKKKWWPLPRICGRGMGGTKGWTSDLG